MIFSKRQELIFISHLDLIRLFQRIMRRAELPLYYTQGYHPHPKMQFARALRLGVASTKEHMTIFLTQKIDLKAVRKKLNTLLPKGIHIRKMVYGKEKR